MFGAYLADTRWGRFKTVCICVGVTLLGHCLLVISAIPGIINHPNGALACFIIALIIMGLGTGGFKANISPLVAEQYRRTKLFVTTTKKGERVIVDPTLTTSRIYMVRAQLSRKTYNTLAHTMSALCSTSTCSSTSAL